MTKKTKFLLIPALLFAGFFCIQNISAAEKININTAGLEELDTLPGIGPAKAQAIIDYRNLNGPFQAIEDIKRVSGIGDATYNNLKDLITVGGEAAPPISEEEPLPPPQEETGELPATPPPAFTPSEENRYKLGDIVINEFVSDPADGEVEWVELFNNTGSIADLSGWAIEEGGGAKTILSGVIDRFLVIEKPKGNLNNAGDTIFLRDAEGNLIDQVAYGNWNDGDAANNAPTAGDPSSTARKFDGINTFNNANDFAITETSTKGASNIIKNNINEANAGQELDYDYSDDIIITEIFPNPEGDDSEGEFIELFNKGDKDINLKGWRLGDESKKEFLFKEERIIKIREYLAISRSESGLALNNTGDSVKIFQPEKESPLKTVKYKDAIEDWSYALNSENRWVWTEAVTPGKENIIKAVNHPPVVDFGCLAEIGLGAPAIFDSSDTIDEDGDELKYAWNFGDGLTNNLPSPEHTFLKEGNFAVKLTVSDGKSEAAKEKVVKVSKINISSAFISAESRKNIIINEALPAPEGADAEEEWVEIKNQGGEAVNLLNWRLDDAEGGSQPYKIAADTWLEAGSYLVIGRPESGLALNNTSDAIRLFDDFEDLIDETEYEAAVTGEAYARGENGKWFWTTVATPGDENVVSVAASKAVKAAGSAKAKNAGYAVEISLAEVKNYEAGDRVKTAGIVAVLPGVFGSQYFYITATSTGLQIYSYKKDFPGLKVGDYIEVSGELSEVNGEKRLKTKQKTDIKVIESGSAPAAERVSCDKINDESAGMLVKIAGEVTDRKSSIIYLDDGTDEAEIYIKKSTGIGAAGFKEGDNIEIAGIVGKTKSGLRIMPRSADDIIKAGDAAGQVLGAVAESDEWELAARDKKTELFKYLLIIAGGTIIVLGGLLAKAVIKERK